MPTSPIGAKFVSDNASFEVVVGSPGTAAGVLTIGSYNWNDQFDPPEGKITLRDPSRRDEPAMNIGELSGYSSRGYRRFGTLVKPDVVAPGQWFSAPAPQNVALSFPRDATGWYWLFNGTSAATPYTAGIVALAFQQNPTQTVGELRARLIDSATKDRHTGAVPNPEWGHGKLDYAAVQKLLKVGAGKK